MSEKSSSTPIAKGTNRILAKVLETETLHDGQAVYLVEVLEVQGSGGSVRSVAQSQKIKVRVSDSFKQLYAKNNIQIDAYFQKKKEIILTIKPHSNDKSLWQLVQLHQ